MLVNGLEYKKTDLKTNPSLRRDSDTAGKDMIQKPSLWVTYEWYERFVILPDARRSVTARLHIWNYVKLISSNTL